MRAAARMIIPPCSLPFLSSALAVAAVFCATRAVSASTAAAAFVAPAPPHPRDAASSAASARWVGARGGDSPRRRIAHRRSSTTFLRRSDDDGGLDLDLDFFGDEDLASLRDRAANAALLESLFAADSGDADSDSAAELSSSSALTWTAEELDAGTARRGLVELGLAGRGSMAVVVVAKEEDVDDNAGDDDGEERDDAEKDNKPSAESAVPCLFLAAPSDCAAIRAAYTGEPSPDASSPAERSARALPLPLSSASQSRSLRLLSFAFQNKPISKSLCLTLNPLLTNRDGSLWDNLPWTTWSVDPLLRNRDAATNPIEEKYHLGKRDAFNRMMGKDWPGRSLSVTNLVARALYMLEGDDDDDSDDITGAGNNGGNAGAKDGESSSSVSFDEDAARILARRVLELELREAQSALAEAEQYLAMLRAQYGLVATPLSADENENANGDDDGRDAAAEEEEEMLWSLPDNADRWTVQGALDDAGGARARVIEAELALTSLSAIDDANAGQDTTQGTAAGEIRSILSSFLDYLTADQPEAPYRGAMGYAPTVDSKDDMFTKSILPHTGPYDLLVDIIRDQLNAEVIGTVVENTSLFRGELILGGAVVLRRRGVKKSIQVEGQTLELEDEDDELGNAGVRGGETFVVECDVDEAVGLALAAKVGVCAERGVWEGARIDAGLETAVDNAASTGGSNEEGGSGGKSVLECIPLLESKDDRAALRSAPSSSRTQEGRMTPQAPQTTDAFTNFFRPKPRGASMFPTENPVTSLEQYDALTTQDKAGMLLSLDSFGGRLPRPRALRNERRRRREEQGDGDGGGAGGIDKGKGKGKVLDPLDELLVPLIDESVRRRVLIRDAEGRGDAAEAEALRGGTSKRQRAKARAEGARDAGEDDEAAKWEEEADFYGELRADVTQDEGEYSRFLDKDEWYERDRLARAKRLNKKKFGTLLDGTGLE